MAKQVFPCTLLESTKGDRIQQFKPHAFSPGIAAYLLPAFSMAFEFGGLARESDAYQVCAKSGFGTTQAGQGSGPKQALR